MKKASFFATMLLFIGFMGYLSPKQAEAIIIVDGYANPFSLVGGVQAVQFHFINVTTTPPDPDKPCMVEVHIFGPDGKQIEDGTCMMNLREMEIATCGFAPDRDDFQGRNPFVAHVKVEGPNKRACMVLVSGETYDMTSMVTDVNINFGLPLI
jgi:hypothetical protein